MPEIRTPEPGGPLTEDTVIDMDPHSIEGKSTMYEERPIAAHAKRAVAEVIAAGCGKGVEYWIAANGGADPMLLELVEDMAAAFRALPVEDRMAAMGMREADLGRFDANGPYWEEAK